MKKRNGKLSLSKESLRQLEVQDDALANGASYPCDSIRCTTTLLESIGCGPYPSYNPCSTACNTGMRCY
jgi:hypothetical protein